ncbi:potassium channel family protein [Chelatococcus reniformis]|uniref:Potassium channel domain-containing protein n=1 Tax=Chelatococcus reniformis TaxID=1494448 RepID=A0A916U444_9HYPH|nr:potassium channel family protein [Chelatococcus reniformis]GGC56730.1 hypothetical protein GCM10010994_14570 [Chelatococcus reniformis]
MSPLANPFAHWLRRNHAFAFLGASVVLILLSPFAVRRESVAMAEVALLAVAIITASMSLSLSGWRFLTIVAVATLWLLLRFLELSSLIGAAAPQLVFAILTGGIFIRLANDLLRARAADLTTLASALSGFLMLGIFWSQLYGLCVTLLGPKALHPDISHDDVGVLVYFSFSTLATIGYGDVLPLHPLARMMAVFEAVTGLFYNAVVIARLVSLYGREAISDPEASMGSARDSRPVPPRPARPIHAAADDDPI